VVTLTGTVPTYAQKWIAERTVHRVYGVKAVANDIEVRLTGDIPADAEIARPARSALEWDVEGPADRITVTVSNVQGISAPGASSQISPFPGSRVGSAVAKEHVPNADKR
jgi:hypothetical protein